MKYRTSVDIGNMNSSQSATARLLVERLEPGSRILDVGCAAGDLGAELILRGYEVVGIERDPAAAEVASSRLSHVHVSDLATCPLNEIVEGQFDAVVFGDVLEHLVDPKSVLKSAQEILTPTGIVIASVPNIAHGSIRIGIALGQWDYTDEGLLDRTHLRFFTLETIKELFAESGFVIDSIQATIVDPLLATTDEVPQEILDWLMDHPGTSDFQYVVEAHAGTSQTDPEIQILRLGEQHTVETTYTEHQEKRASELSEYRKRAEDLEAQLEKTSRELQRVKDQLVNFEEERLRILTVRDYALGMEQSYGRAQYELAESTDLIGQLRKEIVETHKHLAAAIADSQQAHARLAEVLQSQPLTSRVRRRAGSVIRRAGLR